jgi:hypothetical protein
MLLAIVNHEEQSGVNVSANSCLAVREKHSKGLHCLS